MTVIRRGSGSRKQRAHMEQKEGEVIYSLSLYISSDALIPSRLNLLTSPNSALKGGQVFRCLRLWGHFSFKLPHVCTCVSVWGVKAQSQHWGPPQVLSFLSRGLSLAECGAHQLLE